MEQGRLGRLGQDRGTKLQLPVVGGDQMEEMQAHLLGGGGELLPALLGEIPPDRVHQFDPDREMAEEFTPEFRHNAEPTLRRAGLPELARVVEEDTRDDQIPVKFRIDTAEGEG